MLIRISSIIVLLIIVVTVGSFYFYHVAIVRDSKDFLNESPDLQSSPEVEQSKDITKADKEWWNNQSFDSWEMDSDDGIHLKAYYLAVPEHFDKTVITSTGIPNCRTTNRNRSA